MDKAKIIHRDISGGNILILPKRVYMKKRARYWIKWTGLLVDWELSKPVESNVPLSLARQPERTVSISLMYLSGVPADHCFVGHLAIYVRRPARQTLKSRHGSR